MLSPRDQFLHWSELFSRYNTQTSRRDKWFRLAQYISKFIVLHFTDLGMGKLDILVRLKKLEAAINSSRKCYRIVGSIDFFQKAVELYRKPGEDKLINSLSIIANVSKILWLFHDHLLWAGKIGILQVNSERLGRGGAWCWVVALVSLIIRDLKNITNLELQMGRLRNDEREEQLSGGGPATAMLATKNKEWRTAQVELLKDCLDLTLPLNTLGRVGPKLAAACGILSTLIGIKQEWRKLL